MYCQLLIVWLIVINSITYGCMWIDKWKSKKKGNRIPERTFFIMALLLGAPGVYLGMKTPVYHKAGKPLFRYGIPALILLNGIMVFFLCRT